MRVRASGVAANATDGGGGFVVPEPVEESGEDAASGLRMYVEAAGVEVMADRQA